MESVFVYCIFVAKIFSKSVTYLLTLLIALFYSIEKWKVLFFMMWSIFFFFSDFSYKGKENIEYSSLCYTVGPLWLSILCIV